MKRKSLLGMVAGVGLVSACVTINVYFPAAAAEKAADTIIEEVWGKRPGEASQTEPQSRRIASRLVTGLFDAVLPAAQAQVDLEISTPAINKLKNSMRSRHEQLVEFYNAGAVGLTGDGLIDVRDAKLVGLSERNRVKQLVELENRDRNALYREIALANGHPEWEPDIRATFSRRWVSNSEAGWWFQSPTGWQQK